MLHMPELGPRLLRATRAFEDRCGATASWQLISTLALGTLTWTALAIAADRQPILLIFLLPLAAGVLLRLFMIQHDCSHGSFFPSETWNVAVGRLLGVATLAPFDAWRATHRYHHSSPGHLGRRGVGDVLTLTTEEFSRLSLLRRILYRAYRNPLCLILIGGPLTFLVLYRIPGMRGAESIRARSSVMATNASILMILLAGAHLIGTREFLVVYLAPLVPAAAIGAWFFFVQHQFENTYWETESHWNFFDGALAGSSHLEVPRLLNWFTGNVSLHHIHHLNPRVPNYRLRELAESEPEFAAWKRLHWREGLRATRLALWDPTSRRLIPFGHRPPRPDAPPCGEGFNQVDLKPFRTAP